MKSLQALNNAIAWTVAELAFALGIAMGVGSFAAPIWLALSENPAFVLLLALSWKAMKLFGAAGVAIHDAAKRSMA